MVASTRERKERRHKPQCRGGATEGDQLNGKERKREGKGDEEDRAGVKRERGAGVE